MTALLAPISPDRIAAFVLVLARLSPLFVLAPVFSSKFLPAQVRGIVAVILAAALSPLVLGDTHLPVDFLGLGGLVVKELLVGLAYALAAGALVHAVVIAGTVLDTLAGFSFGAVLDPVSGNQSAILSQLFGLVAVMVFVVSGGDGLIITGLMRTYDAVPLTGMPQMGGLVSGIVASLSFMFVAALQVAAPVLLALTITDAGFGVVSRVVPQLNIYAVGFPAKLLVAFAIVIATLPFMSSFVAGSIPESISHAMELIR